MFSIYDSYFAQYTTTSRDFQHIATGNSDLCLIIKVSVVQDCNYWISKDVGDTKILMMAMVAILVGSVEISALQVPVIGRHLSQTNSTPTKVSSLLQGRISYCFIHQDTFGRLLTVIHYVVTSRTCSA